MTLEEVRDSKGASRVTVQGGESLSNCKINFSGDGKWIFVCCNNHVKVFSYSSHDVVYTLSHHSAKITGIVINPKNKMQLFSTSLDGHLAVWDYTDGSLLKVVNFGCPLFKFGIRPSNHEPSIFFAVQKRIGGAKMSDSKNADFAVVGVSSHVITERKPTIAPSNLLEDSQQYLQTGRKVQELVFSYEGSYIASYSGKKLMICDIESENFYNYRMEYDITAVTFHPRKMCIATGNKHGEIHLWYDFAQPGTDVVTTTLHWHAHAVGDICFTSDGTYLLSGGEESVLVLWQLDTNKKQFRPRLGSPITKLACSPGDKYFAVTIQSNVVRIVSGLDTEVEWTLGGLRRAHSHTPDENGIKTGLVQFTNSKLVALNSTPGFLQFYNPRTDSIAYELDVANLNYVSRFDEAPLVLTSVDHVAFSFDGHWMATVKVVNIKPTTELETACFTVDNLSPEQIFNVESRDDGKTAAELRMKFWEFNETKQRFVVNTCVDPPHGKRITGLAFQPDFATVQSQSTARSKSKPHPSGHTHHMAVSTSIDGHFKMWVVVDAGSSEKIPISWACRSVGYYHSLPCVGAMFCQDGTLLAVNFQKCITLWDPITCEIKRTFKPLYSKEDFVDLVFGHHSSSHCLVASSTEHLHVWDLLSCSLLWCVKTSVDLLISDPCSPLAATFVPSSYGETHLYVFDPSSPTPLAVHGSVCKGQVVGAVFVPQNKTQSARHSTQLEKQTSTLYFINKQQVLYTLSEEEKAEEISTLEDTTDEATDGKHFNPQKAFHEIFGSAALKDADRLKHGHQDVIAIPLKSSSVTQQLLNAPPHVLPPINSLCRPFLHALLPASKTATSGDGTLSEDDADSEMEDSDNAVQDSDSSDSDETKTPKRRRDDDDNGGGSESLTLSGDHKPSVLVARQRLRDSGRVGEYDWLTEQFKVL